MNIVFYIGFVFDFGDILTLDDCARCKECCVFKPESLVYAPKGVSMLAREDGSFACAMRCEQAGCKLGAEKPMECAAWPFSISRRGSELLLILERSCPVLNSEERFAKAKEFAVNSLAEPLLAHYQARLGELREYDGESKVLLRFSGEFAG